MIRQSTLKRFFNRTILSLSFVSLVACADKKLDIQLDEVTLTRDGRMAWSQADRPSIVDLDNSYNYTFAELPTSGEATQIPWASDYWSTYKDSINQMVAGETQTPAAKYGAAFNKPGIEDGVSVNYGVDARPTADICESNDDCESKNGVQTVCAKRADETKGYCIETWTGICHAWAPAAILEKEPEHNVTHNGVEFTVMDLKGLITLAYDKGSSSEFVGTRCNKDLGATEEDSTIEFDEFGRPLGCEDTNPGTLHLVLANLVGIQGKTLVEDRTIDYQVWNQPIRGYEVLVNEEVTESQANELIGVYDGQRTENAEGTVAKQAWNHQQPYTVSEGETVKVELTGTGDADLYVQFGSQPSANVTSATLTSTLCAPYKTGSTENCEIVVPAGQTQVFVSVYAYNTPAEGQDLNFTLVSKLGGQLATEYKFNDDAVTFRKIRTRVSWITEAYAARPSDNGNLAHKIDNYTRQDTYDYILEIDAEGKIIGGEWYGASKKDHPDFLWLPTVKTDVEVALVPTWHINEDITVAAGELKDYESFEVEAGQRISFSLNGDGDADLLVGIGSEPTDEYNACSFSISNEDDMKSKQVCAGTVQNNWGRVYVKVKGIAETSNVRIRVNTQTPGTGITWGEVQELLEKSLTVNPCDTDNGGCGDAAFYSCTNNEGTALCADIDECATANGGCGDAAFYSCTNNTGAEATCADINECATNNGECGNALFYSCTNNIGAAPTCADINECETNNGGCGNATYITCTNNTGATPTCTDINECETNNGGCLPTETCINNMAIAPTCQPAGDNGSNGNGGNNGGSGNNGTGSNDDCDSDDSTGGFNWGCACEDGGGDFQQPIAASATVVVGDIPSGKANVRIDLTNDSDVDIQLIDKATGHKVIAWTQNPAESGDLNGPTQECTTYEGVEYCYSGYNGDCGLTPNGNDCSYGKEWIEIRGVTNRVMTMRAYGYAAGDALVEYTFEAPQDCVDAGSGDFSQPILHRADILVGDIPAGKSNIRIELKTEAGKDVDIRIKNKATGDFIIAWTGNPNTEGTLNRATRECFTEAGVEFCYSGYNGINGDKGHEYITIEGTLPDTLTMSAFGYQAGSAEVRYAWGTTDVEDDLF